MKIPMFRLPKKIRNNRGMALLMVMIGVVVCSILTAGYLGSQGTSIGIARNGRDASKCQALAQTGVDMCYWLIRNKSDWRETMNPGSWLTNAAVGDGTVSVSVSDGDNTGNFSDDPTQPVTVTSTGTYDNRAFTLTATIRPTGGGTVFNNGNFINGTISLGNGDLFTPAIIDSYNSSAGAYNPLFPGSNAAFGSNSLVNNALTVYFPSVFRGSYIGAPTTPVSNLISLIGVLATGPSSTSTALENRTPGSIISPNLTGLVYRNSFSWNNILSQKNLSTPGRFDSFTISNGTVNITASGIYYITGNMQVGNLGTCTLNINDGVSAIFVVDGNVSLTNGQIKLGGTTSQMAVYFTGNFSQSGGLINNSYIPGRFSLFGTSGAGNINFTNAMQFHGSVFAPQSDVTMQNGNPKFYGAMIARKLTMKDFSQLHFDEALRSLRISNITGGSAFPGTPEYKISITGGPGVNR